MYVTIILYTRTQKFQKNQRSLHLQWQDKNETKKYTSILVMTTHSKARVHTHTHTHVCTHTCTKRGHTQRGHKRGLLILVYTVLWQSRNEGKLWFCFLKMNQEYPMLAPFSSTNVCFPGMILKISTQSGNLSIQLC